MKLLFLEHKLPTQLPSGKYFLHYENHTFSHPLVQLNRADEILPSQDMRTSDYWCFHAIQQFHAWVQCLGPLRVWVRVHWKVQYIGWLWMQTCHAWAQVCLKRWSGARAPVYSDMVWMRCGNNHARPHINHVWDLWPPQPNKKIRHAATCSCYTFFSS